MALSADDPLTNSRGNVTRSTHTGQLEMHYFGDRLDETETLHRSVYFVRGMPPRVLRHLPTTTRYFPCLLPAHSIGKRSCIRFRNCIMSLILALHRPLINPYNCILTYLLILSTTPPPQIFISISTASIARQGRKILRKAKFCASDLRSALTVYVRCAFGGESEASEPHASRPYMIGDAIP